MRTGIKLLLTCTLLIVLGTIGASTAAAYGYDQRHEAQAILEAYKDSNTNINIFVDGKNIQSE